MDDHCISRNKSKEARLGVYGERALEDKLEEPILGCYVQNNEERKHRK